MKKLYLIFILILCSFCIFSAPSSKIWEVWDKNNENNRSLIDHQSWNTILNKYVIQNDKKVNLVNYIQLKKNDHQLLKNYIDALTQIKITDYSKTEQKAYWINLYNALTVQVIIEHYPTKSILDIDISGFFSNGPWDKKLVIIEDKEVSLNDIEHRILRPIWKDQRIHYAVNCASYSCPNLHNQAYTAQNTENILKNAEKNYINSDRGVKIENSGKTLVLSRIFDWYQVDFGKNEAELLNYLQPFLSTDIQKAIKNKASIDYDYDWSLNEVK